MREPLTRSGSWRALDAAAFDAAVERVVAGLVAAPADDTAGSRVVARLLAAPSRPTFAPRLLLAPAALLAVVVFVVAQRTPMPDETAGPVRPQSAAPIAATGSAPPPPATPEAADTADNRRQARLLLIGAAPGALTSGARRRSRVREAAPVDDGPALPPLGTAPVIDIDALPGAGDQPPGPAPLPVDALELVALDAAEIDPHQDR